MRTSDANKYLRKHLKECEDFGSASKLLSSSSYIPSCTSNLFLRDRTPQSVWRCLFSYRSWTMQKFHIYTRIIIAPAYFLHSLDFEKKFSAKKITLMFLATRKVITSFLAQKQGIIPSYWKRNILLSTVKSWPYCYRRNALREDF